MSWRPIFVHEFLDHRLANYNGVKGEFATSSPPPPVSRQVLLLPGAWFTFSLERPRTKVIGLDVSYRVHAPASGAGAVLPLLTIPGAFSAKLRFATPQTSETVDGHLVTHADLLVDVAGAGVAVETLRIPHRFAVELRVAWHTSGQLHMWLDGTLQAYQPGIHPGARLTIGELSCGDVGSARAMQPRWFVDQLTVRALDEVDAVDSVVGDLPLDDLEDLDHERCRLEAIQHAHVIVDHFRQLMRTFIAATTQSWRHSTDPDGSAFDESAIRAHAAASSAFTSLMRFLREGDETARSAFLKQIGSFLSELNEEVPQAYAQLLNDLEHLPQPLPECLDLAESVLSGQQDVVEMLAELADETVQVARDIHGGDGG